MTHTTLGRKIFSSNLVELFLLQGNICRGILAEKARRLSRAEHFIYGLSLGKRRKSPVVNCKVHDLFFSERLAFVQTRILSPASKPIGNSGKSTGGVSGDSM